MLWPPEPEKTHEFAINCGCRRIYSLTLIGDRNYYRQNIVPTEPALRIIRRELNNNSITHDTVIESMTGIAEFENGTIHICIRINGVRGVFDCERSEGIITLISFWRTC